MGSDDDAFLEAMRELGLVRRGTRVHDGGAPPAGIEPDADPAQRPDAGAQTPVHARDPFAEADAAFLAAMAAGERSPPAPRADPPGATSTASKPPKGTPRSIARRLRARQLEEDGSLDLHGMTRQRAHAALGAFLSGARRDGWSLVRIITGRGLHSRGDAVLRDAIVGWLREDFADDVVEIVKAPRELGGDGARYVVLRRST